MSGYTIASNGGSLALTGTTPTINTNNFNATISAVIAGTQGMAKTGTGVLTLSGVNTYLGATDVRNGTVQLSSGSLNVDSTLNLGNGTTSGKFILGGTNVVNQTVADLTITGTGITNAVVGGNASVSTLTVNKTSGTSTFFGILGGVGTNENKLALTKSGNGTLSLSGANSYTGGTTVSAGTLMVAHVNALGTGAVLINGGSVVSSVTSVTTGSISMSSGGTLNVNGVNSGAYALGTNEDFTMSGGTLELSLNGVSTFDQILGSGTGSTFLLTGGTLDLSGNVANYLTTYQIFSGFNSGSVSGLSIVNYNTSSYTANLSNTGLLSFTAVPEPGPWALGGVGAVLLLMRRRRSGAAERA